MGRRKKELLTQRYPQCRSRRKPCFGFFQAGGSNDPYILIPDIPPRIAILGVW